MMVKKERERELLRSQQIPQMKTISDTPKEIIEEILEIPAGSCPSCYFCTIIRRIGESVYCSCANPERTLEGMYRDYQIWVRSKSELSCYKEPPKRRIQKFISQ
jgi:hypothetical protein